VFATAVRPSSLGEIGIQSPYRCVFPSDTAALMPSPKSHLRAQSAYSMYQQNPPCNSVPIRRSSCQPQQLARTRSTAGSDSALISGFAFPPSFLFVERDIPSGLWVSQNQTLVFCSRVRTGLDTPALLPDSSSWSFVHSALELQQNRGARRTRDAKRAYRQIGHSSRRHQPSWAAHRLQSFSPYVFLTGFFGGHLFCIPPHSRERDRFLH
jgi:hypothetical protein